MAPAVALSSEQIDIPHVEKKRVKKVKTTPVTSVSLEQEEVTPVTTEPKLEEHDETPTIPVEETGESISHVTETIDSLIKRSIVIKNLLKEHDAEIRSLKSLYKKEVYENGKKNKNSKRKNRVSLSKPHGFAKQTLLSKDLTDFLELPADTMLSGPQVTKLFGKYIRAHELYVPGIEDKSIFRCDERMQKVLGDPKYPVTTKKLGNIGIQHAFWNLQKTMKHMGHYIREEKPE